MSDTKVIDRNFLEDHYNSILDRSLDVILKGGNGDIYHTDLVDNRIRALVLLIRLEPNIADNIDCCIQKLKAIEPQMYYYPKTDFHLTLLDLLKGEVDRRIPDNIEDYIEIIGNSLDGIKPFEITFEGLCASENAVMVKGYYGKELYNLREKLRNDLPLHGLKLDERYRTVSSHITIARLTGIYQNPSNFLSFIHEPYKFGTQKVSSIELTFHSWCDSRKHVIKSYSL